MKLGNSARGYFEGSYVNRQGGQTLAPEPLNLGGEGVTVSANNIYNPFGVDLPDVRRRLLEFGTRDFRQDIDTFRIVAGLDGTLPEETGLLKRWYWDASLNFGRTVASNTKHGNHFIPALRDALGPSMMVNGKPTCVTTPGDPTTAIAGCVPLDLFSGPGTITSDQITPNIAYTGNQRGFNQLVAVQLNATGELFKLLSERPLGLAVGYDYRIVSGENIPDPITVSGLTTGNKGSITGGHYYANEGYAELSLPIVSGIPFAENVEATAATRVFNYSNFGSDYTYKFGGRWTLVRDFTLRGTYSTGFRAPSIPDLFQGATDNFPTTSDPCRGPRITGAPIPQNCLDQGIPATGTGDTATQLRARIGGNPDLKPEKANIYTAGVVFEPRWVPGFSATLDYYNISITKSITNIGAQLILNACYPDNPSATPRYCDLVQRDPAMGLRITNIIDFNTNIGKDETDGIDLALNYLLPTQVGRLNFSFDGTWLHKFDRTLADGSVIHGKNTYDISADTSRVGGVYPAFKFISGVRWSFGGLDLGVNTRFFSSFHECGSRTGNFNGTAKCYDRQQPGDVGVHFPEDADVVAGNAVATARKVSAYSAWDLFASYAFPSSAGRTTIGAGVANIFNADPPKIYNGFPTASDPTAYDFVGRFFYGRVSHAF
jgi:outer membrane receptor protein involved in Fe transport